MCAGGKISRLAGIHLEDIPCVIACVEWLGTAQRCVRSCGEFSAYKGAAHVSSVSNKAVCVCVCAGGKISRLAGVHHGTFLA